MKIATVCCLTAFALACSPDFLLCQNLDEKLFDLLSSEQSGVHFNNQVEPSDRLNIIKYLYFYNGGGVAVGDLNNDGLPDLYFTANQLPDRLYLNRGDLKFEDVTEAAGISLASQGNWKTGVTFADINADGWLDIYVCEVGYYKSIKGRNRLYINNGRRRAADDSEVVTFTEQAAAYGLDFKAFSQQAAFFDYDLDGDLDCFLLTHSTHSASTYVKAEKRAERDSMAGDFLLENLGHPPGGGAGKATFIDVSEKAGIFGGSMGYGLGLVVSDLDSDGDPDIYVSNDFHENDYLYLNLGNGTFKEIIKDATAHNSTFSMGVDAADCNNDALPDLLTLDMRPPDEPLLKASGGHDHYNLQQMKIGYGYHHQYPRNSLQLAVGSGQWASSPDLKASDGKLPTSYCQLPTANCPLFTEIGQQAGISATDWSWSGLFADLDNDGWKDIFITNGIPRRPNDLDYLKFGSTDEAQRLASDRQLGETMPPGEAKNFAFQNTPPLPNPQSPIPNYLDVSAAWGLDLFGCSHGAAYADLDLDGDLDLVVNNLNAPASIYRNNAERLLSHNFLNIRLEGSGGNPFGIGAKVIVKANGVTQMQEHCPVRGWQSSVDYALHFGLGSAEKVDTLHIHWPGGKEGIMTNLPVNQALVLRQATASLPDQSVPDQEEYLPLLSPIPNPQSLSPHRENRFNDFNVEPLMPHQLSTQGPRIAIGKGQNGTSLRYLCAAKGAIKQVAVSVRDSITIGKSFEADLLCEDTDAAFFDADSDGDQDLYVVSGGGEYREGAPQLRDRLYLNDGTDHFIKKADALPDFSVNGACVEVGDFNVDGFPDLFRGGRSVPGSYGLPPRSFIFLNDGKGHYRDATEEICPDIARIGMLTDAVWLPQERRLALVGEWNPLIVFDFSAPFPPTPSSIAPQSRGWWNTLTPCDPDGDGDMDLLAGNFGLNSNLSASPDEPLELYVKDFDDNGTTDPTMSYYKQALQYCHASKDELTAQLSFLKKRFPDYAKFAKSSFKEVFPDSLLRGAALQQAETLASCYFENLGNGQFRMTPLPAAAQTAPIFAFLPGDFDGDGHQDALAVGNWYAQHPSIGRADASHGWFLKGDGKGGWECLSAEQSGFFVRGEGRDLKLWDGKVLVARNNEEVLLFGLK